MEGERGRDGEDEHCNLCIRQKYGERMQTEEKQRHIDKHMVVIARCLSYALPPMQCQVLSAQPLRDPKSGKINNRYA